MSVSKKIKIDEDKTRVSGYVQNVSPIRTSRTNSRYFNAVVKTQRNEFNRIACFDVAKHSVLVDASQAQTPLKLSDVQLVPSRIDSSKSEVLLNYKTRIEVCRTLNFNFKKSPDDDDKDGEKVKSLAEVQATPEHNKLWNTCHHPNLVRASLKKSMDDLGLTYLDLYLIHWPVAYKEGGEFHPRNEKGDILFSDVDYVDTWKALEDCVDEGLVKYIGLSNFNSEQINRIQKIARIKPVVNQVEIHVYLDNNKLVEFCKSQNIIVTAYSPLGSPGNKSSPYTPCLEEPTIMQIAEQKKKTPAQVVIRFLLQRGISVIPKTVSPSRISENLQVFDFELTDEDMKKIYSLNKDYRLNKEEIALTHPHYPFHAEF